MPSLQSKVIVVLLRLMGMKRTVNRIREYDGVVHDWMLGPLPEAKQVLKEIADLVRR